MPHSLIIQAYLEDSWHDALVLQFANSGQVDGHRCVSGYVQDYLLDHLDMIDSPFEASVSVCHRLGWNSVHTNGFPAFVYDIIPSGAARKTLERRFGHERPAGMDLNLFLLERCAPAPIGHLRVKESTSHIDAGSSIAFNRADVVERTSAFIEYAYEQGAAIGGATGAGGEAPKLLMTEDTQGHLYADATLVDEQAHRHWLVKFARNQAGERDRDILRTEYHYYQAIRQLGLDTIPADGLMLEEADKPSLWMPRFDRRASGGKVERVAMESVYSLCNNARPGSHMQHEDVIARLAQLWTEADQQTEIPDLIFEYVRRDLLNRILGNSDNHGRNTSITRSGGRLALAPIYDLAPMVLDPEGISRVTKWREERLGEPQWRDVCEQLKSFAEPEDIYERLRQAARELLALPDLLTEIPPAIKQATGRLPVLQLESNLKRWGLL
ncbi:HipA domain-containing protein [Pseudomonas stutzeri]|uniref:Toxin HipA n=1 Tax=Stutzerimonas stutzeri TaxID=316 RepID=A0A2N8RWX8_STUST|nr:HipA domain-containing protein [Stutzerimonas stutzeri]MCQ4298001.1 HipA domain-containing protein [Stutzerimonas stutzeri]PNF78876.1 toxin HipA [Stutzerimonas stutzeri]